MQTHLTTMTELKIIAKVNSSLTDIKIFNRFSKVGSCGMSFCTTLLKASNIEWS